MLQKDDGYQNNKGGGKSGSNVRSVKRADKPTVMFFDWFKILF